MCWNHKKKTGFIASKKCSFRKILCHLNFPSEIEHIFIENQEMMVKKGDGKNFRYENIVFEEEEQKNTNPTFTCRVWNADSFIRKESFNLVIGGSNSKAISFPIQSNQEGILFYLEFPFFVHSTFSIVCPFPLSQPKIWKSISIRISIWLWLLIVSSLYRWIFHFLCSSLSNEPVNSWIVEKKTKNE